jgi:hypothetical protein
MPGSAISPGQELRIWLKFSTKIFGTFSSVLRIRDVYPGSRIPDPKTGTKESEEKKFVVFLFFNHKNHKIINYFIIELVKKIIWANLQRIIELFTPKIAINLSKI